MRDLFEEQLKKLKKWMFTPRVSNADLSQRLLDEAFSEELELEIKETPTEVSTKPTQIEIPDSKSLEITPEQLQTLKITKLPKDHIKNLSIRNRYLAFFQYLHQENGISIGSLLTNQLMHFIGYHNNLDVLQYLLTHYEGDPSTIKPQLNLTFYAAATQRHVVIIVCLLSYSRFFSPPIDWNKEIKAVKEDQETQDSVKKYLSSPTTSKEYETAILPASKEECKQCKVKLSDQSLLTSSTGQPTTPATSPAPTP
jgi:hypothetical protein